MYDWSSGGEAEIVVEDIERIDFDRFDKHDKKLKDWRLPKEGDWCEVRMRFTDDKPDLMNYFNVPRYDVPELLRSAEDGKLWRDVWFNVSEGVTSVCCCGHYFFLLLRRLLVWNMQRDTMQVWATKTF